MKKTVVVVCALMLGVCLSLVQPPTAAAAQTRRHHHHRHHHHRAGRPAK